jgi:hypothetical protein
VQTDLNYSVWVHFVADRSELIFGNFLVADRSRNMVDSADRSRKPPFIINAVKISKPPGEPQASPAKPQAIKIPN